MERGADEVPVHISPALNCQWRWREPRTLACQLVGAATIRPATRYRIAVFAGVTALDGEILRANVVHQTWRAPGWPVMRLVFSQW